jgi:putative component of membrane protein insertase Oxa1/YidC/SpoIIIJ protein YidD
MKITKTSEQPISEYRSKHGIFLGGTKHDTHSTARLDAVSININLFYTSDLLRSSYSSASLYVSAKRRQPVLTKYQESLQQQCRHTDTAAQYSAEAVQTHRHTTTHILNLPHSSITSILHCSTYSAVFLYV